MDSNVKFVYSGNDPEFMAMKKEIRRTGIRFTASPLYSTQCNGLAERMNRTILDNDTTSITEAGLYVKYKGEAELHGTDLCNRIDAEPLKTPHEELFKQLPNNSELCTFGCVTYVDRHNA